MRPTREPAFNAPGVIPWAIAVLALIHAVRWFLSEDSDVSVLLTFAFIPARYDPNSMYASVMLGGEGAEIWTFLTYALLHGDITHLAVNAVWMLAFGSAVAWRFGTPRFLLFSALTAIAGAATHLVLHPSDPTPVVGASAAISGYMAAAMRFMFESGGPLSVFRREGPPAFRTPAVPLLRSIRTPQVLVFLAVWFGTNILFGLGSLALGDGGPTVAWEAHIGGFLAGLALFPLIDPKVEPQPASTDLPPPWDRPHDDGPGAGTRF